MYKRSVSMFERVLSEDYDIIICLSRSCYNLFKAIRPALSKYQENLYKVTNDKMILAWINYYSLNGTESIKKAAIVDDMVFRGMSCVDCITRLRRWYDLGHVNFSTYALCIREQTDESTPSEPLNITNKKLSIGDSLQIDINYAGNEYFTDAFLRERSLTNIKAFHAISQAYTAYMPSFTLPTDDIVGDKKLLREAPTKRKLIDKDLLSERFANWEFSNITTTILADVGVDAFILIPPSNELKGQPEDFITDVIALRIYVNHVMENTLIIPYTSFKDYNPFPFSSLLPPEVMMLVKKSSCNVADDAPESNYVISQNLNRLLRYSSGFYFGIDFLSQIGIDKVEAISYLSSKAGIGGINCFFNFLFNNDYRWLLSVWNEISKNLTSDSCYEQENDLIDTLKLYYEHSKNEEQTLFTFFSKAWEIFTLKRVSVTKFNKNRPKDEQYGISLSSLRKALNLVLGSLSNTDFYSLIFKLCDYGRGVTQVAYLSNSIQTVIRHGETLFQANHGAFTFGLTLVQRLPEEFLDKYYHYARAYAVNNDSIPDSIKFIIQYDVDKELKVSRSKNFHSDIPEDDFFMQLAYSLQSCYSCGFDAEDYLSFLEDEEGDFFTKIQMINVT